VSDICVVSSNYPSQKFPARGVFVRNLVESWRELGASVQVVAPRKLGVENGVGDGDETGLRPWYISFGDRQLSGFRTGTISDAMFSEGAAREARRGNIAVPRVVYGHFLLPSGLASIRLRDEFFYSARVVVALGESDPSIYAKRYGMTFLRQFAARVDRFVAVSDHLKSYAISELNVDPERILLAPNEARLERFQPLPKANCRDLLQWSRDRFVVVFVGHLNERKGARRLCDALGGIPSIDVVLIGAGEIWPVAGNIQFAGVVNNEELPIFLSAADLFVLPTLGEGRCNAVEEALACELPVVMGDVPGSREQVVGRGGVTVPPLDVDAIRETVTQLRDDVEGLARLKMEARSARSLNSAVPRAQKILTWILE